MSAPQPWPQIAEAVLRSLKAIAPQSVPALPDERHGPATNHPSVQAWAEALSHVPLPPQIWRDAVTWWAINESSDRMIKPADLKRAAYAVRDDWNTDPEKRPLLERWRDQRMVQRYRELGLDPAEAPTHAIEQQGTTRSPEQIIAETRRRAIELKENTHG